MSGTCKHERTHQHGDDRAFVFPVAVSPYTEENRAAHGGISWTEECDKCGSRRAVNQNQHHIEVGPWGLPRIEREAAEAREAEARCAQEQADAKFVAARVTHLWVDVRDESRVVVTMRDGARVEVKIADAASAATQPDNGDGLVPFYRGLGRLIQAAQKEPGRRVNA